MTLQSGKEVEKDKAHIGKKNDEEVIEEIEVVQLLIWKCKPSLPYLVKVRKDVDKQFKKFLDLFKQIHINIRFVEPLSQMPKYAKFLNKLLSNMRRM